MIYDDVAHWFTNDNQFITAKTIVSQHFPSQNKSHFLHNKKTNKVYFDYVIIKLRSTCVEILCKKL